MQLIPPALVRSLAWLAPLALLVSAVPLRAGVLVVDAALGPGADFAAIQAAVSAAAEGDTILVRPGSYAPFTITAKSLSVVADGAPVQVLAPLPSQSVYPAISVRNLALNQRVLVRGMRTNFGLSVTSCAGAVLLEDIQTGGATGWCSFGTGHGATITGSSKVTLVRCVLLGESIVDTQALVFSSAHGLVTSSSTVQLFDCALYGGAGRVYTGTSEYYLPAGSGMRSTASTVTLAGCTIEGGSGGRRSGSICTVSHYAGGPGVEFSGAGSTLRSAASTAVGGALSLEPFCPGQYGPRGPAISGSGTIVALPGLARHLLANSPVRAGETLTFALAGQAGEIPVLLISLVHDPLPALNGTLLVGLPASDVFVLAPLPPSGTSSLSFPVPSLGALVESLACYAQAAFLDPSPALWLGAGTSVVLLDASF